MALALMNQFVPLPNVAGTNNFTFNPVTTQTTDQYIWRVDHTFGSKDTITGYGYWQKSPSIDTLPFTGATLPGFGEHAARHYNQYTPQAGHIRSARTF